MKHSWHPWPWFIWFSFFSCFVLILDSARQLTLTKNFFSFTKAPRINTIIFYKLCGNVFKVWGGIIILPAGIIATLGFYEISPIILYGCGVYATYDHWLWRKDNLNKLDWRK